MKGGERMTTSVQELLQSFDQLPDADKRELATHILRRTRHWEVVPLTDEDLVEAAEEVFLELDQRESADESAASP